MFNTFSAESFTAPVEQLVSLNLAVFKKTIEVQTQALNGLVELTDSRLKAMAQIKDPEGLNSFVKEQNELTKSSISKALNDSQTAVSEVKAYNEEVVKIVTDSIEATAKKAA